MFINNNILAFTIVSISFSNVVSSYSLAAIKTDLDNYVNSENLVVKAASFNANVTCSPRRDPDSFPSKCCGHRYVNKDMKKDDRIKRSVGSEEASSREYPWVALLEYPVSSVCTGFLISNTYVLTAAHCVVDMITRPTSVRLGHHGETAQVNCSNTEEGRICNDGAISVPIENITVHSNYSAAESWKNDIAIIKLNDTVQYSEYIQPICLPTFEVTEKSVPGVLFDFAGWGTTNQTRYSFNNHTYYINHGWGEKFTQVENMPYKSNEVCQKLYDTKLKGKYVIRDTHICSGGIEGKGPCSGDSGGPLMYKKDDRYVAVGIISFTTLGPCAFEDIPAVFTNIYKYDHWIREHTTGEIKLNNKLSYNVTSNHGTLLTSVTKSVIFGVFCLYYTLN